MMIKIALLSLLSVVTMASAGLIPQHGEEAAYDHGHHQQQHHHYPQATSYQHVKIENYHPVPVYIKKEHAQLLEHPISKGHTATNVQIHHGAHQSHAEHEYQDPGYAVVSGTHQDYHQGLGGYAGHEEGGAGQEDGGHYEAGDYSGHDLQQYAHAGQQEVVADYGHQPSGYEQESNDYEQEGQHLQYHH